MKSFEYTVTLEFEETGEEYRIGLKEYLDKGDTDPLEFDEYLQTKLGVGICEILNNNTSPSIVIEVCNDS